MGNTPAIEAPSVSTPGPHSIQTAPGPCARYMRLVPARHSRMTTTVTTWSASRNGRRSTRGSPATKPQTRSSMDFHRCPGNPGRPGVRKASSQNRRMYGFPPAARYTVTYAVHAERPQHAVAARAVSAAPCRRRAAASANSTQHAPSTNTLVSDNQGATTPAATSVSAARPRNGPGERPLPRQQQENARQQLDRILLHGVRVGDEQRAEDADHGGQPGLGPREESPGERVHERGGHRAGHHREEAQRAVAVAEQQRDGALAPEKQWGRALVHGERGQQAAEGSCGDVHRQPGLVERQGPAVEEVGDAKGDSEDEGDQQQPLRGRAGLAGHLDGGNRLKRTMCQSAATPSRHPIFLPSA